MYQARILLVATDEVVYAIVARLLSELGDRDFSLSWAESYEEGLRLLLRERHDLALVDRRLGERPGLDLFRDAAARNIGTPLVLIGSHPNKREGTREDLDALALGAAGFLETDRLDAAELERTVLHTLRRERMVSELADHNEELVQLHELTRAFLDSPTPPLAFRAATERLAAATGFPSVRIQCFDARHGALVTVGEHGSWPGSGPLAPRADDPGWTVVRTRRPQVQMACDGPRPDPNRGGTSVRLPMLARSEVIGILTLAHPDAFPVDSLQIGRAATLANHLASLVASREIVAGTEPAGAPVPARRASARWRGLELEHEVQSILGWFEEQGRRRGIEVDADLASPLPRLPHIDRPRIDEVLTAYLGSALRFAAGDRIEVRAFSWERPDELVVRFDTRAAAGGDLCHATCERLADQLGGRLTIETRDEQTALVSLSARFGGVATVAL